MTVTAGLLERVSQGLGPRDLLFLQRVVAGGIAKYRARLAAVGFHRCRRVLDVGCGFGQWTLALAETAERVYGIDVDRKRVEVARALGRDHPNVEFCVGSMSALSFAAREFDGVLCYSAIYYTDVERSVRELARVLRPGGRLYVCSNGFGWYLYNIVRQPNPSPDFSPCAYGVRALWDTTLYRLIRRPPSPGGSVVTSRRYLARLLEANGVHVLACGEEGTVKAEVEAPEPVSFFLGRYLGLECASEWLGVKVGG